MNEASPTIDAEERLYMAIHAANSGRCDSAIIHLKYALEQVPDNVPATFLLAAQYATVGLYQRAITTFERTLELDEAHDLARLQLCLLLISLDKLNDAKPHLLQLANSPLDYARLFAGGLKALIEEDLVQARVLLLQGLDANQVNPPLNDDFSNIIAQLEQPSQHTTSPKDPAVSSSILRTTYGQ